MRARRLASPYSCRRWRNWAGSTGAMCGSITAGAAAISKKPRKHAMELAADAPDAIFATGTPAVEQLLKATRAVPIVFAFTPDPVGAGLVESLSQPGGNATGFLQFEYSLSG